MALQFDAEVTGLHVTEVPTAGSAREALTSRARDKMERLIAEQLMDCKVVPSVERGDPAQTILSYARSGNYDLVMMPTHGYGPFRRFLQGSVTAQVLHDASCPVWTCAHLETWPAIGDLGIRSILSAVDLGPRSAAVLTQASQLAERFEARLTVAHLVPEGYWTQQWWRGAQQRLLEQIQKLLPPDGPPAEIEIVEGSPASLLPDVLDHANADLVVIGRTHSSGNAKRLGGNAYSIIVTSPCPVLSV